jgi:hypothetical protein
MTCSDVERVLPELLDSTPVAVDTDFETHLKSCSACSDLVSDIRLISSEANQLAATDEPAPRVWAGIAAQLRAEGLIRESGPTRRPVLLPSPSARRWTTAWWLAPVAAAVLAAGAYVISHQPAAQVANSQAPNSQVQNLKTNSVSAPSSATPDKAQDPATPAPVVATKSNVSTPTHPVTTAPIPQKAADSSELARTTPKPAAEVSESNDEDQQFLSVVSTRAPSMRATYESQLQAVNTNIRQVQEYLHRNPADMDARQQLMDAYQQKALLYQIALDRIQ